MTESTAKRGIPEDYRQAIDSFIKAASDIASESGPSQVDEAPGEISQPAQTRPAPSGQYHASPPDPEAQEPEIPMVEIVSASCDFDIDLLKKTVEDSPTSNVVLSPLSVRMALAMAYNGADGPAKEAMAEVLGFQGLSLEEVNTKMHELLQSLRQQGEDLQLEMDNSLWGQEGERFCGELVQSCLDYYGAELQRVDFKDPKTLDVINGWVKERTNGRIPKLIPSHDLIKYNVFAFLNAVFFKAEWTAQFDESFTRDDDFTLADGRIVRVPLMQRTAEMAYLENDDFQAVCLPYGDTRMGMYVFLPAEGKSLGELYNILNRDSLERWIQVLEHRKGTLYLPRFEAEYGGDLKEILEAMGMAPAFHHDLALPKIIEFKPGLAIDLVIHKANIEVNEEGTEGAAATYLGVYPTCPPPPPPGPEPFVMKVNRPFFFAIRDNQTGAILFVGSIGDPS